ncbi:MAG: tyrosine-type recombinase/integrase [Candidatus Bathyarchaeia archaeon]
MSKTASSMEEIDSFLAWMHGRYKPATRTVYESILKDAEEKRQLLKIGAPIGSLNAVELGKIQAAVQAESEKKWILATSVLKTFYKWRGRQDLWATLTPQKYSVTVREPVWLEEKAVSRIIDAAEGAQNRAMLQTAYDLALRCGEVCLMDKAWINWKAKTALVKREKSHREILTEHLLPVQEKTLMMLQLYLKERGEDEEPALFIREGRGRGGKERHRIDSQTVQVVFNKALEAARIPREKAGRRVTFHSLRHSRLTHMALEGLRTGNPDLSIVPLAKFAGHRRTDTTLIYLHLAGEALR